MEHGDRSVVTETSADVSEEVALQVVQPQLLPAEASSARISETGGELTSEA